MFCDGHVAHVVVPALGEEAGLRDDRQREAAQPGDELGRNQRGVLDPVSGAGSGVVERGKQQDQRLAGDAVDGYRPPGGVGGADAIGQRVDVGKRGIGEDDLERTRGEGVWPCGGGVCPGSRGPAQRYAE